MAAAQQQVQELHSTEGSGGVWQGGQGLNPTTAGRSVEPARACGKSLLETPAKTTPKIIRPDIFSDDDDASTIVSRSPYKPKTNGIKEKEQTSSDDSSQDDHATKEPPHDDHSEQENDKESDEKDSTVDEALLNEALNYEMPEMYELHSERPKKGKRSGLPMPRKIKVRSSLLLLLACLIQISNSKFFYLLHIQMSNPNHFYSLDTSINSG